MKFLLKFLFLIVFFASASVSFSQDKNKNPGGKPAAPIEFRFNVLAVNQAGAFVDNLKAEDFKIYEDGVEQKISYFAEKEPVLNLAMVFDNSGSMNSQLKEAAKAGKMLAANLGNKDEAFVVRFVSSEQVQMIQDYTSNKTDLITAINNLFAEGGQTAILDAIYLSAEKLLERENKNKNRRYAVVLFSDAEDRDSYYKLDQILKKFENTDLQIFVVSYAEYLSQQPRQQKRAITLGQILTQRTGGTLHTLPKKHTEDDLLNIIKSIIYELRSQYIIGYTSTNQTADHAPRQLTVEIANDKSGEKRQIFVRGNVPANMLPNK